MSRILARVTRGKIRIGTTKGVLVLATAGMLFFQGTVVPPSLPAPPRQESLMAGGPSMIQADVLEHEARIKFEDELVFEILKMWVKWQN